MTLVLTRTDVESLLTLADCLPVIEEAFRQHGEGLTKPPQSTGLHATAGTFHIKAAMAEVFAAKINANFPGNSSRYGLPTIQGLIVVMDLERGTPLAILDSTLITTLRTAAATAIAAKYLSREHARTLTIIGCGVQGRASVSAMQLIRPISKVYAIDADENTAQQFAAGLRTSGLEIVTGASIDDAVSDSEIVVTCTTARSPILYARHLHEGLFIAAVGADNPEKQELAPELLQASRVVTDLLEQAATMGDLHHALKAGLLTREDVHGELPAVISGRVAPRRDDPEVFVFDSTGSALQDVAVAGVAIARAAERGAGLSVEFA